MKKIMLFLLFLSFFVFAGGAQAQYCNGTSVVGEEILDVDCHEAIYPSPGNVLSLPGLMVIGEPGSGVDLVLGRYSGVINANGHFIVYQFQSVDGNFKCEPICGWGDATHLQGQGGDDLVFYDPAASEMNVNGGICAISRQAGVRISACEQIYSQAQGYYLIIPEAEVDGFCQIALVGNFPAALHACNAYLNPVTM